MPTTVAVDGKVLLPSGLGAPGGEVRTLLTTPGSVDDGGTEQLINGFSINPIGPDGTVAFSLVPNDIITTVGPNYYRAAIRTLDKPNGMPIEWIVYWDLFEADGPTINIGDIIVAAVFPANPLGAAPSSSPDADAIHDNIAGEIAAIGAKSTLVGADLFLLEDSESGNAKRKVTRRRLIKPEIYTTAARPAATAANAHEPYTIKDTDEDAHGEVIYETASTGVYGYRITW